MLLLLIATKDTGVVGSRNTNYVAAQRTSATSRWGET
jgi:hypothetical protein